MGQNDFCCAHGCSNNRKRNQQLKFYRIPKEQQRKEAWLKRIRRDDFTPTENSRLCSAHFVGGDKSDEPGTLAFIPSIFHHSHSVPKTSRSTRNSIKTENEQANDLQKPKRRRLVYEIETPKGRPKPAVFTIEDHSIWGSCLPLDHELKVHDYCKPQVHPESLKVDKSIIDEMLLLQKKIIDIEEENKDLRSRCLILEDILLEDKKFQFWTGFPNYGTFKALFDYLDCVALQKKTNWRGFEMSLKTQNSMNSVKKGPVAKLTLEQEFFMVLVRLRVGLTLTDLALRFSLSESSVSKIFSAWINLLYFHLKDLCQMPTCEDYGKAKQFSPFPDLKVIVDCTEIFTQKPSSLQANKEIYSSYKSHTTFKFLVAINAHAAIVYVSRAWGGRTSDKYITANSADFIATLEQGDEVMADRGFDIDDLMGDRGVKVTIPDFKGQGRSQLKEEEGKRSEKIAEARIHVERAIQRIKTYHILDSEIRLSMAHLAEQIFTVCSYLVNFQAPILREI